MTKIQETLNSLQPYLIGIRYLEGTVLVDVVFKNGWSIIESSHIKAVKGDDSLNYYMFFSESPNIGLDDLLANVRKIINFNLEREKKQELLNAKIIELKKLFKHTDLKQLNKLKFTFVDDDELSYALYDDEETIEETKNNLEEITPEIPTPSEQIQYINEDKDELTEEEREILEEEARGKRNLMMTRNKRSNIGKIEPPPIPRTETDTIQHNPHCDCDENSACEHCIDYKTY